MSCAHLSAKAASLAARAMSLPFCRSYSRKTTPMATCGTNIFIDPSHALPYRLGGKALNISKHQEADSGTCAWGHDLGAGLTAQTKLSLTNLPASSMAFSSLMSATKTLPVLPSAPLFMATSALWSICPKHSVMWVSLAVLHSTAPFAWRHAESNVSEGGTLWCHYLCEPDDRFLEHGVVQHHLLHPARQRL